MKSLLILKPLPGRVGRRIQFIDADKAIAIKTAVADPTELTERQERFIQASHIDLNTVDDVRIFASTRKSQPDDPYVIEVPKTDAQIAEERYR